jgi:signal transduction histidine kinase
MFASRVAHDLLSPLSATAMALALVQQRAGGVPGVHPAVARGLSSLMRVRQTVDGLLQFARAGAQRPEGATARVVDVVRSALEGAAAEAEERGIALVAPEPAPCEVACSEGVLTSLVTNLVVNAIRHMDTEGRAEPPRVVVRASPVAQRAVCRLEVEDNGPGVPEAIRPRMFEQFVSGDPGRGGVGLGLATVKRLAEGHGGACGHRPAEPRGSVFWVELPLAGEG